PPGSIPVVASPTVRLLHPGDDHDRRWPPQIEPRSGPRRDRQVHAEQHLPMRHLSADCGGRPTRGRTDEPGRMMAGRTNVPVSDDGIGVERYELSAGPRYRVHLDRREFLKLAGTSAIVMV